MPVNHSISTAHCFIIRRKSRWLCIVQFDCVVSLAATRPNPFIIALIYINQHTSASSSSTTCNQYQPVRWWWLLLQHHRRTEVQKTWKKVKYPALGNTPYIIDAYRISSLLFIATTHSDRLPVNRCLVCFRRLLGSVSRAWNLLVSRLTFSSQSMMPMVGVFVCVF